MNALQPRSEMSHDDMVAALNLLEMGKSAQINIVRAVEKCPYHNQGFARDYAVRLVKLGCITEVVIKDIAEIYGKVGDA